MAKLSRLVTAAMPVAAVALLLLAVPPVQGLLSTAPTPNAVNNTSFITVTLTFEDGDIIPIDELQLVFDCSATGVATDRFNVDGSVIAQTRTSGSATVGGSIVDLALYGDRGGYQTGYGYGVDGPGTATGERGFVAYGYGYGYGYGYSADAGGSTLSYTFTLLRSAFALNESCTVVLVVDTPLAGDFDSPRSPTFRPRLSGGGGGGGAAPDAPPVTGIPPTSPPPANPLSIDSDGDGVPDFVEDALGTDPNDPDSNPSHDWSSRVTVTRVGNAFVLTWTNPDGFTPLGFQVWRSNSPFVLVGTLDGNATSFTDLNTPLGSVYKTTWFTDYTEAGGYYADASSAAAAFGWPEAQDDGVAAAGPSGDESRIGGWPMEAWILIGVAAAAVAVAALVAVRRRRGPD